MASPAAQVSDSTSIMSLQLVLSRWRLIAACALIGGVSAFSAGLTQTPIYSATALLSPLTPEADESPSIAGVGGLASIAGVLGGKGRTDYLDRYIATLKSRKFCERFIGKAGVKQQLVNDLNRRAWLRRRLGWESQEPTVATLCKYFDKEVRRVSVDARSSFVTLVVRHQDRHLAAAWATALVAEVNDALRTDAIAQADASVGYLTEELRHSQLLEVREAITRALSSRVKTKALAATRPEYAFSTLDPATVADMGSFDSPRKLLMAVAGMVLAVLACVAVLLFKNSSRRTLTLD